MIEQQYYTSAPKRLDGNSGFGIKAQSPGMASPVAKALEQYARYGKPYQVGEQDMDKMPISFSFYAVEEGVWGVTRSQYVGMDFSGRWGNFFAHSIVLSEGDLQGVDQAPIRLENASFWISADTGDSTTLPSLEVLPSTPDMVLDQAHRFLQALPERDARFGEMLQALIGLQEMGRRLILVDSPDNISHWIVALTCALPPRLRRYLTFSTYQRDPYPINLALVGTRTDGDFRFSAPEYQFQFAVFNFETNQFSTGITPGRAANLLTDTLMADDTETLAAIHDLASRLELDDLKTLDSLAAVVQAQSWPGGVRRAPTETLQAMREIFSPSSPGACLEAFALIRRFAQDVMAAGDRERLALFLPIYYALTQKTQNAEALRQDIMRFVRQQLRINQGLETLQFLGRQGQDLPLVGEIVQQGMTVQDWASFLENTSPSEAELSDLWSQMEPSAMKAAAQNDMALWQILSTWAESRNSTLILRRLETRLMAASGNALQTLRAVVDTVAPQTPTQHEDVMIKLCLALLEKGLAAGDGRWQDDVARCTGAMSATQREAAFLGPLIGVVKNNSKALVSSLISVLEGNATVVPAAAAAMIESHQFQSVSFLRAGLYEPRLEELFRRLWHDTARSGKLALFMRAILDSIPSGQPSNIRGAFLQGAVTELCDCAKTAADFDTFYKEVPEVGQDPGVFGLWLLGKLRLSPLTILDDSQATEALRKALEKVSDEDLWSVPTVNAYLSFKISKADQALQTRGAFWKEAGKFLALDSAVRIDPILYSGYVREALHLLVDYRANLVLTDEVFEALFIDTCLNEFIDQYLEYIAAYKREPQQVLQAVYSTLAALGKRSSYARATISPAARLVKCLRSGEQEALKEKFALLPNRSASRIWWEACFEEGTKTFLGRLFHR
jgi:hypothetical protein